VPHVTNSRIVTWDTSPPTANRRITFSYMEDRQNVENILETNQDNYEDKL